MPSDPILWVVILGQLCILAWCLLHASGDDAAALDDLREQFDADIVSRAHRGDGPDWVRYMDEADRVHGRRFDQLQVWATAALVVGIGGTMATLAFRPTGTSPDELRALIAAVGPALYASLSGVVNNLIITLVLFRWSDSRFRASLDAFRNRLRQFSDQNPPQEKFANAVRDQLGIAFKEAVSEFPHAFARLDESVQSLGGIIQEQSTAVLEAAAGLKQGAESLTGAAKEIVPVAGLLKSSTDRLGGLPEELKQAIAAVLDTWERKIRRDQESFISGVLQVLKAQQALLDEAQAKFVEWERQRGEIASQQSRAWAEAIESIQRSNTAIVSTVAGLPDVFSKEVAKVAHTLGREFGLEARQHVADLAGVVREGNESLRKQIESATADLQRLFLNETSEVVAKTLEDVYRRVEGTLLTSLDEVGKGIREALVELPDNARSFAGSLSAADEKLRLSIGHLDESARHLKEVAELTEGIEKSLAEALAKSTAPIIESMRDDVRKVLRAVQSMGGPTVVEVPEETRGPFKFLRRLSGLVSFRRKRGEGS